MMFKAIDKDQFYLNYSVINTNYNNSVTAYRHTALLYSSRFGPSVTWLCELVYLTLPTMC